MISFLGVYPQFFYSSEKTNDSIHWRVVAPLRSLVSFWVSVHFDYFQCLIQQRIWKLIIAFILLSWRDFFIGFHSEVSDSVDDANNLIPFNVRDLLRLNLSWMDVIGRLIFLVNLASGLSTVCECFISITKCKCFGDLGKFLLLEFNSVIVDGNFDS